jgi:hypothetical protein
MTTTEEIIVSGEDFIERRIVLFPEQEDLASIRLAASKRAYKSGWINGFVLGAAFAGLVVFCIWLVSL